MCLQCVGTNHIKANGKRVLEAFLILKYTVYVEFRVCFTYAKYENDMFSIETSNAIIDALCYSIIHFHQSVPFKLIKTMLNFLQVLLGLSPVWNRYPKGRRSIIAYDEIKDRICKE